MTSEERIRTIFDGGIPDRVGAFDSIWVSTLQRWREEGLPEGVSPLEHLGLSDIVRIGGDDTLRFRTRVTEETDGERVYVDQNGVTRRDLKIGGGWTPQWLDFTIKDRMTWEIHKHRLAYDSARLPFHALEAYQRAREAGKYVMYYGHLCYHSIWHWVGQERALIWMAEQPDLLHDMYETFTTLVIEIYEGFRSAGLTFDGAFLADDVGYRNGTLFSNQMYRDLVMPYHKRFCDHVKKDEIPVTLHTDGNVTAFIPQFIEAGFRGLHPLEAKSGMDLMALKQQYGKQLVLQGNVDVRALASTREAIEEEIQRKVGEGKSGGRYIYHSDHSVPDDVPWENYIYAIEMVKKYGTYNGANA